MSLIKNFATLKRVAIESNSKKLRKKLIDKF